jgi:hypothetical protein
MKELVGNFLITSLITGSKLNVRTKLEWDPTFGTKTRIGILFLFS